MEEQNKDTNQNPEEAAFEETAADLPEPQNQETMAKFEMPSWFAMVISLGLFTVSSMLIMSVALIS